MMKTWKIVCAALFLVACTTGDDDYSGDDTEVDAAAEADAALNEADGAPEADAAPTGKLVINEVEGDGTPDWVELFNGTNAAIDLSTYYLSDNALAAEKLTGTIAAGGYKVLLKDTDFTFGLGKGADAVTSTATTASPWSTRSPGRSTTSPAAPRRTAAPQAAAATSS